MTYRKEKGFTLAELMVAVSILAIFFLAAISAFFGIGRGILITKTRTIATTLAQEKIEFLKNIPYYRLIVSTDTDYDRTYYPPETEIMVGGTQFERRVFVRKVKESGGNLVETNDDCGLKKIKTTVLWEEDGEEKTLEVTNLYENSERSASSAKIYGTITTIATVAINRARVVVVENPSWEDYTLADGEYCIRLVPGNYNLRVTHREYFDTIFSASVLEYESVTENASLFAKGRGSVQGRVVTLSSQAVNGGIVYSNDGLSPATTTNTNGYYFIQDSATGTWTISAASGTLYGEVNVNIAQGVLTSATTIFLNPTGTDGFIYGQVTRSDTGSGIGNIYIQAGAGGVYTGNNGYYWLAVTPGSYYVTANPNYENANFTTQATTVTVSAVGEKKLQNFLLQPAGMLKGQTVVPGNDPLPDVMIQASGPTTVSAMSGHDGYYSMYLPLGTYTIEPVLDIREVSDPSEVSITLNSTDQGQTVTISTFTIKPAYGTVKGVVKEENKLIETGVLIIASTTTLAGDYPPTLDSDLREGGLIYYGTISHSNGTYSLEVRGQSDSDTSYYVYAWYTKMSVSGPVIKRSDPQYKTVSLRALEEETIDFTQWQ